MTNIRFTKFTNKAGELGKIFNISEAGKLVKEASGNLYKAEFESVELPWTGFGNFITSLNNNTPISASVCKKTNGGGKCVDFGFILPKKDIKKSSRLGGGKIAVSRTKDNFIYHSDKCPSSISHNLFYIDIDDISTFEEELEEGNSFHNPPKGTSWGDHVNDCMDVIVSKLLNDLPELKNLEKGIWAAPSSGALCFCSNSNEHTGLTGVHLYFLLPVEFKIEQVKNYIERELWSKGLGYFKLSKNASALSRTYVDLSTLTNNRLDFIGGAKLGKDLIQPYRTPIFYDTYRIFHAVTGSTRSTPQFNPENTIDADELNALKLQAQTSKSFLKEQRRVHEQAATDIASKENVSIVVGREIINNLSRGVVKGSASVTFDSLDKPVKVWKILLNPSKYHKLTATDPTRTEKGPNKAQLYYNPDYLPTDEWEAPKGVNGKMVNKSYAERVASGVVGGREVIGFRGSSVLIHSFVSGGKLLRLEFDFASLVEMISTHGEDGMTDILGGNWMQILSCKGVTDSDRITAFNTISRLRKINGLSAAISDIKSEYVSSTKTKYDSELETVLKMINKDYFMVYEKSTGLIYYRTSKPWRGGHITEMKSVTKENLYLRLSDPKYAVARVLKSGETTYKSEDVAKAWCHWHKRNQYEGLIFKPDIKSKTIYGADGQDKYLNLFNGFSQKAVEVEDRSCAGKNCDGKGCFNWFFSEGYKTCNWTELEGEEKDSRFRQFRFQGKIMEVDCDGTPKLRMASSEYEDWGCGSKCGTGIQMWLRNVYESICTGNIEHARWVVSWIADLFKNPGRKPGTALVCRGGQGSGKGMLMRPVAGLAQDYYVHAQRLSDLTSNFNSAFKQCLIVFADESTYGGDVATSGVLKGLITEAEHLVEKKGVDKERAENFMRAYIASNELWVIPADEDDRRYCVFDTWYGHFQDKKFFGEVAKIDEVLGDFLAECLVFELSDVHQNLMTIGLSNQKDQNKTIIEVVLDEIMSRIGFNANETEFEVDLASEDTGGYEQLNNILKRCELGGAIRSRQVLDYINVAYPKLNAGKYCKTNSVWTDMSKSWSKYFWIKKQIRCRLPQLNIDETGMCGAVIKPPKEVSKLLGRY